MMKKLLITLLFIAAAATVHAQVQITHLQCEYKENPLGVETQKPYLGWEIKSTRPNFKQSACRVLVTDQAGVQIWDSGKRSTNESVQFPYNGPGLKAGQYYYWKVTVWDEQGHPSASEKSYWQMGLLQAKDWHGAKWIAYEAMPETDRVVPAIHQNGPKNMPGTGKDILPLLRKEFTVKNKLKRATAYITGLGQFDASLNGQKIGDHFLDPAWTNYDKEALYVPFDITSQIKPGKNTIGLMLGNGMYYVPRERYRKFTGAFGYPKAKCLVVLQYQDGHTENVISDESWKTAPGPITFSSIYGGEDFDARLIQAGWNKAGFDDHIWKKAVIVADTTTLHSQKADPVMVLDSFVTQKITHPKPGVWVYDMGQNVAGIPQVTVKGAAGATIRITPAELLTDSGLVTQQATGNPSYFTYTLNGKGTETWQPQFAYNGFRYLQVEGDQSVIQKMQSLHIRNSAATAGHFYCSNELFNKTFNLINWAIKSNMVSIFTDCPTREKLGWLEQDHLMANSIRYNYDALPLFRQTMRLMRAAQTENGFIPNIAPEYVHFEPMFRDSPEWGSTGVILPWYVYQWYGDQTILAENYDMIKGYVGYLTSRSKDYIINHGLGDWFDIGPKALGRSQLTPLPITGTAYYYYDTKILADMALLLGKQSDAKKYADLATAIKKAYNDKFFNKETGNYSTGSQAANAISVYMGLVAPENKKAVVANIVADVRKNNNAITAGDIGFRYLLKVLADEGRSDVIFEMNNRSDVPGYGFQLAHGATSLTESWQAFRNVSNNHLMLGHLMEWFYNDLAGIQYPDARGTGHVTIKPQPVGDVTFARADYASPYGAIKSDWKIKGDVFTLTVDIPANMSATIELPQQFSKNKSENGKLLNNTAQTFTRGSGIYYFIAAMN